MKFNLKPESINYIKINYKDTNNFLHVTKAGVKRIDSREIYASTKYEEDLHVNTPQEVELSFISDDGLYKTKTDLKYISKEEPYIFFSLKTPLEIEYFQNREYFRVKIEEDVIMTFIQNNEVKRITGKTHDISANGICVEISDYLEFPEEINITILFDKKEIKTKAKYIRTDTEDKLFKASFHFIDLKESDLDFISQFCIKTQLENKRKMITG